MDLDNYDSQWKKSWTKDPPVFLTTLLFCVEQEEIFGPVLLNMQVTNIWSLFFVPL